MMNEKTMTCVSCPKGCEIKVECQGGELIKISGNNCSQGEEYARREISAPARILPTTVIVEGGILPLVPVKTSQAIPLDLIMDCMQELAAVKVKAPVKLGDIIISNILNTGADVIATRDIAPVNSTLLKIRWS